MNQVDSDARSWANVSHADAVARLFPSLEGRKQLIGNSYPGRSWVAWEMPKPCTVLDKKIQSHIEKGNIYKSAQDLAEIGIFCPFYSWRVAVITALEDANRATWITSKTHMDELDREVKCWERRIAATKTLLKLGVKNTIPAGTIYYNIDDFDGDYISNMIKPRSERFDVLSQDLAKDESVLSDVNKEIDRIKNMIMGGLTRDKLGNIWRKTFFIYLANLWNALTEREIQDSGDMFVDILREATIVLSDGKNKSEEWGQAKALNANFKNKPPGEGYRVWMNGLHDLEGEGGLSLRGPEMKKLIYLAKTEENPRTFKSSIANSILLMRDYSDGFLAKIMRDCVLFQFISRLGISPHRAALQLGWPRQISHNEMIVAVRQATVAAREGDAAAACVLGLLRAVTLKEQATMDRWPIVFKGIDESIFQRLVNDIEKRDREVPEWSKKNGDHKSFIAAMRILIDSAYMQSTTAAAHSRPH